MKNIIDMALGAMQRVQGYKPVQLYYTNPSEDDFDFHNLEASADMGCVPVEYLKDIPWIREHELSMALVHQIETKLAGHTELLFCGKPSNHFDLWVSPDLLSCKLTILTPKTGDKQ